MDAQLTSDQFAGADKMIACSGGAAPLPLLNAGDAWEIFDTADLRNWEGVHKRQLAADRAQLREAAMKHLRTRNIVDAIGHELARRHHSASAKEA